MTVYLFKWQAGSFVIATSDAGAGCAAVGTVVKAGGGTCHLHPVGPLWS